MSKKSCTKNAGIYTWTQAASPYCTTNVMLHYMLIWPKYIATHSYVKMPQVHCIIRLIMRIWWWLLLWDSRQSKGVMSQLITTNDGNVDPLCELLSDHAHYHISAICRKLLTWHSPVQPQGPGAVQWLSLGLFTADIWATHRRKSKVQLKTLRMTQFYVSVPVT